MQKYISEGVDINILDENSWTPLHLVCDGRGDYVGLELLVQNGAEINALTERGTSPLLMLAHAKASAKEFKLLLESGAKPEIPNLYGWTCLHWTAADRNLEVCKLLLSYEEVKIDAKDDNGNTPLHWMFEWPNASPELVRLFLDRGANANEQNKESRGPLFAACVEGNVSGARLLMEYGADVNDDENVFGETALHAAVAAGSSLEIVELLIDRKADMGRQDKQGRDCIAEAARRDNVDILEYLVNLQKSRDFEDDFLLRQDFAGDTPLHHAARKKSGKNASILLKAGDPLVMCSKVNRFGATPLHLAAYNGCLQAVEVLLSYETDPVTRLQAQAGAGNTPLHLAAYKACPEVAKVLLEYGASPTAKTHDGSYPINLAIDGWMSSRRGDDKNFLEIISQLVGLSSNESSKLDILDLAIERGAKNLCTMLVEKADIVDDHGWDPLVLAIQCDYPNITAILAPHVSKKQFEDFATIFSDTPQGKLPTGWTDNTSLHNDSNLLENRLEISPSGKFFHSP